MKVIYSVVVIFAVFTATYSHPASSTPVPQPNKDVDVVPLENDSKEDFGGVVDVDAGDSFFGSPFGRNPFPSLFDGLDELVNRMRAQLGQILGSIGSKPGEFQIPQINGVDLTKGNTTSETKIIDGHKVTINETEYRNKGENGTASAIFKVRVVDIHPDSSEEASAELPPNDKPESVEVTDRRESAEDTLTNEIPKAKSNEALTLDNIETFDDEELVPPYKHIVNRNVDWDDARSVETIEDNSIDGYQPQQPLYDLSNDIYVNELLANSGAPHNPDAEVFDPHMGPVSSSSYNKPPSFPPMNFPSRFERLPYYSPPSFPNYSPPSFPNYSPPSFPNFQHFDAPPQLNYRQQPPPFNYPNFPFASRPQKFDAVERLRTNEIYDHNLHFKNAPTEFVQQLSSVPVKQPNVPVSSS